MGSKIKFVYFDVGGVLNLDYSKTNKWKEMKRDLGISQKQDKLFEEILDKYKNRICIDFDIDNLIPILKDKLSLNIPNDYSMLEDFVNRFELNPSIWPVVKYAKKNYGVGLLTNMYPKMLSLIQRKKQIPKVDWNVIVDSSVVRYQKPDQEIYKIARQKANIKPENIFFVDNLEGHLDSATKQGWQTFLYDPSNPEKSSKKLRELLNK